MPPPPDHGSRSCCRRRSPAGSPRGPLRTLKFASNRCPLLRPSPLRLEPEQRRKQTTTQKLLLEERVVSCYAKHHSTIAYAGFFGNEQRFPPGMKIFVRASLVAGFCWLASLGFALQTADEEYDKVAEEYMKGYFAARPLAGTELGLHEFDGKISDYSRLALDAELSRLHRFDDRLSRFDLNKLT